MHLKIQCILILMTAVFAAFNGYEEQLGSVGNIGTAVIYALVAGSFSVVVHFIAHKLLPKYSKPYCVTAYASALFGFIGFVYYASNGKADSLESAAHMHVIVFPILHTMLAILLFVAATIWGAVLRFNRKV
ncbi:hypothetical protein ACMZOO_18630 (plasmid) [Catenovulum sp. SX2]|uniref:hypothetical protein n=1 Tax=Catenovulum sp. SX2 TaxID=3398614 RepID=UPI003F8641CE